MGKDIRRLTKTAARKVLGEKNTKKIKTLIGHTSSNDTHASKKPDYGDNTVINHPQLENSSITFAGRNNILHCAKGLTLRNCTIKFVGDNGVIYLSERSNGTYSSIQIAVSHGSVVYVGKNTSFNKIPRFKTFIQALEQKHIIIGDDSMFSLGCWLRTSDAHAIYDTATKERLNPSKSILIGDHVWIGQNVTILKGSVVGSGSIVGAHSVVTGKALESNVSYGGVPAKAIRPGIFFDRQSVENKKHLDDGLYSSEKSERFIFSYDSRSLTLGTIDRNLTAAKTSKDKLEYIKKHLANNEARNRFYIGPKNTKASK